VTEAEKTLRLENIQLRKQAHSYKSLHARALAKQQELEDQIEVLKAKVAELQKRLFGRKMERGCSSEAWLAKRGPRRCRGQQRGTRGHGRQPRTTLPMEEVVVQAPEGPVVSPGQPTIAQPMAKALWVLSGVVGKLGRERSL